MATLSVCVIAFNEEHNMKGCLESVKWADEIIVLDSGSTDKTCEIARQYTELVEVVDWPGYGVQKQRSVDRATCDWVLSLDADERVSEQLKKAIQEVLVQSEYDAYGVDWPLVFNDRVLRSTVSSKGRLCFFRRGKASFSSDKVHEKFNCTGKVGYIKAPLYHYSFRDSMHMVEKLQHTAEVAKIRCDRNVKSSVSKAVFRAILMFLKFYILKGGIFERKEGFIMAMYFSTCYYYMFLHVMFLNQQKNVKGS
ncbi:MAG: glycosyltransferase family 2 protein [bacterium]